MTSRPQLAHEMKADKTRTLLTPIVLVCLSVIFLSSCSNPTSNFRLTGGPALESAAFDPSGDKAVLVASASISRDKEGSKDSLAYYFDGYRIFFARYDPTTQELDKDSYAVEMSRLNFFRSWDDNKEFYEPDHVVFLVDPGSYIVQHVTLSRERTIYEIVWVETEKSALHGVSYPENASVADSPAPRFTLEPGEIVYIGNWLLDDKIIREGKKIAAKDLAQFSRHDDLAQAALARYSNIKGEFEFRQPTNIEGATVLRRPTNK